MRALIIEDDPQLRAHISKVLADEGFVVDTAADGEQGQYMAEEYPADIAIVDLGLPKTSGLDLIRRARKAGRKYPILILTARDGWQSKEELLARVRALLRRSGGWATAKLESGPYVIDTSAKSIVAAGRPVELTGFEYRVLEYLLTHAGKVISKSELTEHLYTEDEERDSNVIEVFIRRLRSKLDPESSYNPITTLRGQGYRWDLPRN